MSILESSLTTVWIQRKFLGPRADAPQFLSVDQMAADGVHPTTSGCKILVERLVASIEGRSIPSLSLTKTKSLSSVDANSFSCLWRWQCS